MLARRDLTCRELLNRLNKKHGNVQEATAVVNDLKREGYLDDSEVARDHIQKGMRNRLAGRFLLKNELRERGVEQDILDRLLAEEYPENSEIEIARKFSQRKLRGYGDLPLEKVKRRLAGSLGRRGFSGETIGLIIRGLDEYTLDK